MAESRETRRVLHIGELAERSGRSADTLRWYEQQGLIPNVTRDAAGRRIYTERHILWLELLAKLTATGMSIEEVREYASLIQEGDTTLTERIELLEAYRIRVEAKVEELREALALIDLKTEMYKEWLREGGSPVEVPPPASEPPG